MEEQPAGESNKVAEDELAQEDIKMVELMAKMFNFDNSREELFIWVNG